MEPAKLVAEFERLCELAPGTLTAESIIEDIPGWSSLAFLGLIALVDDQCNVILKPRQLFGCSTIGDLSRLVAELQTI